MNERRSCVNCSCMSTLFKQLRPEELEVMENNRAEVTFKKGETLIKHGTLATHVMYLKKGVVKNYAEDANRNMIITIDTSGDFIGVSNLFQKDYFPYTVSAYTDTDVCMFDFNAFQNIASQNARFAAEIIRLQSIMFNRISARMMCLTHRRLRGRMAHMLLCMERRIFKNGKVRNILNRRDFAEISQMSVESVSRLLTEFKTDGLIVMEEDGIRLVDYNKLKELSKKG